MKRRQSWGVTITTAELLLGLPESTGYRLHRLGHLRGRRVRRGGFIYVTGAALRRFAASPLCWLYVAPADIPDPELRGVALEARRAIPGRWWSTTALAEAYSVHPSRVRVWRRAGWLEGQWAATGRTSGGWHLWATELPPMPTARPLNDHSIQCKRRIALAALEAA